MLGITAISQSPIASLGGTNVTVAVTGSQLTTNIGNENTTANANITVAAPTTIETNKKLHTTTTVRLCNIFIKLFNYYSFMFIPKLS